MDERYEYHVVTVSVSGSRRQRALDQFAAEGWELVSSTPQGPFGSAVSLTFRRVPQPHHVPPHRVPLRSPAESQRNFWVLVIFVFVFLGMIIALIRFSVRP